MPNTMLETDEDLRQRVARRVNKRNEFFTHAIAYGIVVGAMWVFVFSLGFVGWWWLLVAVTLGWCAGLAAHAVDTWYQVGAPAYRLDEAVWREMREQHGADWRTTATRREYDSLRSRLKQPSDKLKDLLMHGSVFVLINLMVWITWYQGLAPVVNGWFNIDLTGIPVPLLVTVGWGIGMVLHLADAITSLGRTRAVEDGVERERERMARAEGKAKRKNEDRLTMRVGDDGELVELSEDEDEPLFSRRKNRG